MAWAHFLALKALKEKPAACSGRAYFVPDETPTGNSFQLLEPFLRSRDMRLSQWKIPYSLVYGLLYATELLLSALSPVVKINLSTPVCSIEYINKTFTFRRDLASELLGYSPLYSHDEAMQRSLKFYSAVDLN